MQSLIVLEQRFEVENDRMASWIGAKVRTSFAIKVHHCVADRKGAFIGSTFDVRVDPVSLVSFYEERSSVHQCALFHNQPTAPISIVVHLCNDQYRRISNRFFNYLIVFQKKRLKNSLNFLKF